MNTVMPDTIWKYSPVYNIGIHIEGMISWVKIHCHNLCMSWLFNYLTATTSRQPIRGNKQAAQRGRLILQKEGLNDLIIEYRKNLWWGPRPIVS